MGNLADDTAIHGSDGRYEANLSRDWVIWGPNGGYVSAIALRAAAAHGSLTRPAAISAHYLNVADIAPVHLDVSALRASKRAESIRVSMRQGDKPILEALVWLVGEQDGLIHDAAPMPAAPAPDEVPAWTPVPGQPPANGVLPFWYNVEARMVGWPEGRRWEQRPGNEEPRRVEWCRFRPQATFDDPCLDAARSLVLIDTLMFPAAAMAYADPMEYLSPSMDVSVWFHRPAPDEEWLLVESESPVAEGGLVGGSARVWSRHGRLLASGGQQMLCRPAA